MSGLSPTHFVNSKGFFFLSSVYFYVVSFVMRVNFKSTEISGEPSCVVRIRRVCAHLGLRVKEKDAVLVDGNQQVLWVFQFRRLLSKIHKLN